MIQGNNLISMKFVIVVIQIIKIHSNIITVWYRMIQQSMLVETLLEIF